MVDYDTTPGAASRRVRTNFRCTDFLEVAPDGRDADFRAYGTELN